MAAGEASRVVGMTTGGATGTRSVGIRVIASALIASALIAIRETGLAAVVRDREVAAPGVAGRVALAYDARGGHQA